MIAERKPELEALEHSIAESSETVSDDYAAQEFEKLFESHRPSVSTIDGAIFVDDKRKVNSKPKCNLAISTKPRPNTFSVGHVAAQDKWLVPPNGSWVLNRRRYRLCFSEHEPCGWGNVSAQGLHDATNESLRNRVEIDLYNAKFPIAKYPDSKIFPQNPRNASPTREKSEKQLKAFWDFRELNTSVESNKSNWLEADNDNFNDEYLEEGDVRTPVRGLEAEMERRPGPEDIERIISLPTVVYETPQVGLVTGPKLSDCGYCMAPTSPLIREMKIPASGDVACVGLRADFLTKNELAARMSLAGLGIRRTRKQITAYVDRIQKPEVLNISDVAKHRSWSFRQIGDIRFAVDHTDKQSHGEVTHYRSKDGQWRRVKNDEYGTPYGPESSGSNDVYWESRYPRTTRSKLKLLSPAEKAKQWANKRYPLPCPMTAEEALKAFGPANDDGAQYDGLPYDVDSADELQFGYSFGKAYTDVDPTEPFDDVVERKQLLAALNEKILPQTSLVANMVVHTDETTKLAQNYAEVGAALFPGQNLSERTLIRRGQQAVQAAGNEISDLLQELAA